MATRKTEPVFLPLDGPLRALREHAGLTQQDLATRRSTQPSTISGAESRGGGIKVETLAEYAESLGYMIEIVARPKS